MADLPNPIELTKQVWLIPCKISFDKQNFLPLLNPQLKQIPNLKKTKWKPEEQLLLMNLAEKTRRWSAIAKEININFHMAVKVRDGKQCRERWINHLNPKLNKTEWTIEEDCIILENCKNLGQKWARIAELLNNRTENQVKNRWKSLQSRPKEQNFYSCSIASMNLNRLACIEPAGNEGDNVSPIGSFKVEDMKFPFVSMIGMFEESKSPFASMSSVLDLYFNGTQTDQFMNSQQVLDGIVGNKG